MTETISTENIQELPLPEADAAESCEVTNDGGTPSDDALEEQTDSTPEGTDEENGEIVALREEIKRLREEIRVKTAEAQLITAQLGEFEELFPTVTPNEIPQSVWDSVRQGNSLAAAYALHHRRSELRKAELRRVNESNSAHSSGRISSKTNAEYFTPDEVRAMSQSEVRANYSKIRESMKKWN